MNPEPKKECCPKCHCNDQCPLKGASNCCHNAYCECHRKECCYLNKNGAIKDGKCYCECHKSPAPLQEKKCDCQYEEGHSRACPKYQEKPPFYEVDEWEKRLCCCTPQYTERGLIDPNCAIHDLKEEIHTLIKKAEQRAMLRQRNYDEKLKAEGAEEERERIRRKIKPLIDYCIQQNGLPYCKNCGLEEAIINK